MKFTTGFSVRNIFFFAIFFIQGNLALSQDCTSFFGITGEPTQGLVHELCAPNPGALVLNATVTGTTPATAYTWSTGVNGPLLTLVNGGTFTITISAIGAPSACVLTYNVTDRVNPIPDLSASDTVFCDGNQGVLRAPFGFVSYNWSGSTISDDSLTVNTAGWYFVTVTDTNTCVGEDSILVSVDTIPVINLGVTGSICDGDSMTLNAGFGFLNYNWSTGDTLDSISVKQVTTYSVTVTDSNTCVGSDSFVLAFFPTPTVNIGVNDTLCEGNTKLLDANMGFNSYLWSNGDVTQTSTYDTTGNHWVEVRDVNGCLASDTMHLEIQMVPYLNLGPNDSICANLGYNLNAGNPGGSIVSYLWSTGSTNQTISIVANSGLVSDINVDYSVTITDNIGCVNSDTLNLTTFTLPIPDLGNDTSFCFGLPFTTLLNPGLFDAYLWSTGAITNTITIGAVASAYSVTVTDIRGCQNSDNLSVLRNLLPSPNLGPDDYYCQGVSFTKVLNAGLYDSYIWTDGSSGQILGVSSAGTFGVTVTDGNGCENSDSVTVTENPTPIVNLGSDVTYCEDDTVVHFLDATTLLPSNNFDFLWNTGQTTGVINATNFGTFTVLVSDKTSNCFASSTMNILALERAQPELGDDDFVCQGQLVILDPEVSIAGYSYLWSNGATTPTINIFETGLYWVRIDALDGSCVGNSDTVYFSPGVLPVVELGPDQFICDGQTVSLLEGSTPFPNATYEWQDGSKGVEYKATETGEYEVEVTNNCGSVVDQVYLEFQDCDNVYIPSSFTPNGDNRNDVFYPVSDQEFKEYGFWIYDKWGALIFKTNQPNVGWDGKIDGEYGQMGIYVWRISYVSAYQEFGIRVEKTGELNLMR